MNCKVTFSSKFAFSLYFKKKVVELCFAKYNLTLRDCSIKKYSMNLRLPVKFHTILELSQLKKTTAIKHTLTIFRAGGNSIPHCTPYMAFGYIVKKCITISYCVEMKTFEQSTLSNVPNSPGKEFCSIQLTLIEVLTTRVF